MNAKLTSNRKHYIDNLRWITVIIVMLYHVIYIFNCQGVLSNFGVQGIPELDYFLPLVYPWFMCLLFVVAGVSARYALNKRTGKEFAKDRALRLLVTSTVITFLFGWICGSITNYYSDIFGGNGDLIPGPVKFLILCISGIGPMWFAQELFLTSMILLLIRKMDKKDKLTALCSKMKWWGFLLVGISFYLSAQIFNTPLIEVYRNGIYTFSFLMGYYIFSNDEIIEKLSKAAGVLVPLTILLAAGYVIYIKIVIMPQATDDILTSVNYCSMSVLKHPFTNLYAFTAILGLFSIAPKCLNFDTAFSRYMTKANFAYYAFHYYALAITAFAALEIFHLPLWICYIVNIFGMIVISTLLYLIIRMIPGIRSLVLGIYKK